MDFKTLEDIYNHLETEAFSYQYEHQIASLFQAIRDDAHQRGENDFVRLSQIEMDVFNFVYKDGELLPTFTGVRKDGVEVKIPDFESLNDDGDALDYIEERLKATKNPLLQANYSSILWHSSKKHRRYAETAVASYLKLVDEFRTQDIATPNEHRGLDVLNAIVNAFHYAKAGGLSLTDVQAEIKNNLDLYPNRSSSLSRIRYGLLELILNNKKCFDDPSFSSGPDYCEQFAEQKELDPHSIIGLFTLSSLPQ